MRKNQKVTGRWQTTGMPLITELAETGAGDENIMEMTGNQGLGARLANPLRSASLA